MLSRYHTCMIASFQWTPVLLISIYAYKVKLMVACYNSIYQGVLNFFLCEYIYIYVCRDVGYKSHTHKCKFVTLSNICYLFYYIECSLLSFWMCEIICYTSDSFLFFSWFFFLIIFWFCKLLACHNKQWTIKIPWLTRWHACMLEYKWHLSYVNGTYISANKQHSYMLVLKWHTDMTHKQIRKWMTHICRYKYIHIFASNLLTFRQFWQFQNQISKS